MTLHIIKIIITKMITDTKVITKQSITMNLALQITLIRMTFIILIINIIILLNITITIANQIINLQANQNLICIRKTILILNNSNIIPKNIKNHEIFTINLIFQAVSKALIIIIIKRNSNMMIIILIKIIIIKI